MRRSMRLLSMLVVAVISAFPLAGIDRPAEAVQNSQTKTPEQAPCAVCSVREGAGDEPVRATTTYEGKTYYFCQEACRDKFLEDPKKWIKPAAAPAGKAQT